LFGQKGQVLIVDQFLNSRLIQAGERGSRLFAAGEKY